MIHNVKSWPISFNRIIRRQGDFDIRFGGDRTYRSGDVLRLREWCPVKKAYTGRVGLARILEIMQEHEGLEEGYVVLGLFFTGMEVKREKHDEDKE